MSKLIEYFDREKTTVAILKDYLDQHWKIENDPKRIKEMESDMKSLRGISYSTPVQGGSSRAEERLCNVLDEKMILEHGYIQAVEYLHELTPSWERLTDDERDVLTMRYIEHTEGGGISRIMSKYSVSRSAAYRMSDEALKRLAKLLFW